MTAFGKVISLVNVVTGRKQAQDPPGSLHTISIVVGGVKFPKGEGSAVIHRKKNDLLHKDATYIIYIYVCVTASGKVNSLII